MIALYLIFFTFFYWKTRGISETVTYKYILLFYLIGAVSACIIRINPNLDYELMPLSFVAIVYHCLMLYLLIKPFSRFECYSSKSFDEHNSLIVNLLTAIIIPISLYYIYLSMSSINLGMIAQDVSSMRQDLIESGTETGTLSTYLKAFSNTFHGMALSLAVYFIVKGNKNRFVIILLIICSMSQVIHSLNFAAREYVIKYFFVVFMLFGLFKERITLKWKKILFTILGVCGGVGIVLFIVVTIFRFTGSDNYSSPLISVFAYLGQGFVNFSQRFIDFPNGLFGGSLHFPLFSDNEKISVYNLNSVVSSDYFLNSFSTSIGSWIMDCGILWATIVTILYSFLFRIFGNLRLNVFTLYYLIYAYEFIFSCLFFYNDTIGKLRVETFLFIVLLDIINRQFVKVSSHVSKKFN